MIPQVCIGGSHIRTRFFTNCAFSHSPKLYYWCVRSSLQWRIDWRAEDRKRISFIWYWNCIGHWRRGTNRSGLFRKFNDHKIISWYAEKGTKNKCIKKQIIKLILILIFRGNRGHVGSFHFRQFNSCRIQIQMCASSQPNVIKKNVQGT